MSRHYVNADWADYYPGHGEMLLVDCSVTADQADGIDTRDALSDPAVADMEPAGQSLWPCGAAWGTPDSAAMDPNSVIAGLTRALLAPFGDLYRRAWRIVEESRVATIVDSLADWETEYGLPDPCVSEPQDDAARRTILAERVRAEGIITPEDFVRLAARLGYVVALEEPKAFECGVSTCASDDEPTDVALDQQFLIRLHDIPVTQFEAGIGEAGTDRLLDFDIGSIVCVIRRLAPGWTLPFFDIAPLPIAPVIVDGPAGLPIVTESGVTLIAPHYS